MQPPPQQIPVTQVTPMVELFISCQNLINMDVKSLSDPQVIYYIGDGRQNWKYVGKTERLDNTLSPSFKQTIITPYTFEAQQHVMFRVMDVDQEWNETTVYDDYLGTTVTTLGQIIAKKTFVAPLYGANGQITGQITVQCEPIAGSEDKMHFGLRARSLFSPFQKPMGPDAYYTIGRESSSSSGSFLAIYTSSTIPGMNPVWPLAKLTVSQLCMGDQSKKIRVSMFDKHTQGWGDALIGQCDITVAELKQKYDTATPCILTDPSGKPVADFLVATYFYKKKYSFVDYLRAGCEMSLICAVDFTASNGEVNKSTSLHYINAYRQNEYQSAIASIGTILAPYDSDGYIPAYGFGAKVHSRVSHCFPLNDNMQNPECAGVQGVLDAYARAIRSFELYGPTNFAEIINSTAQRYTVPAMQQMLQTNRVHYYTLLIITDGEITDLKQTMKAIIDASGTPLSIIIVGVGNANFKSMEQLDGDDGELLSIAKQHGKSKLRDIVQFVEFRKHANNPSALAAETLKEIPYQFVKYMKSMKIIPETLQTVTMVPQNPQQVLQGYPSLTQQGVLPQQGYPPQLSNPQPQQGILQQQGYPPQQNQNAPQMQRGISPQQGYPPQSQQSSYMQQQSSNYSSQAQQLLQQSNYPSQVFPIQQTVSGPQQYAQPQQQTNVYNSQQGYPLQQPTTQPSVSLSPQNQINAQYPQQGVPQQGYPTQNSTANQTAPQVQRGLSPQPQQGYPLQQQTSQQGYPSQTQSMPPLQQQSSYPQQPLQTQQTSNIPQQAQSVSSTGSASQLPTVQNHSDTQISRPPPPPPLQSTTQYSQQAPQVNSTQATGPPMAPLLSNQSSSNISSTPGPSNQGYPNTNAPLQQQGYSQQQPIQQGFAPQHQTTQPSVLNQANIQYPQQGALPTQTGTTQPSVAQQINAQYPQQGVPQQGYPTQNPTANQTAPQVQSGLSPQPQQGYPQQSSQQGMPPQQQTNVYNSQQGYPLQQPTTQPSVSPSPQNQINAQYPQQGVPQQGYPTQQNPIASQGSLKPQQGYPQQSSQQLPPQQGYPSQIQQPQTQNTVQNQQVNSQPTSTTGYSSTSPQQQTTSQYQPPSTTDLSQQFSQLNVSQQPQTSYPQQAYPPQQSQQLFPQQPYPSQNSEYLPQNTQYQNNFQTMPFPPQSTYQNNLPYQSNAYPPQQGFPPYADNLYGNASLYSPQPNYWQNSQYGMPKTVPNQTQQGYPQQSSQQGLPPQQSFPPYGGPPQNPYGGYPSNTYPPQ